MAIASILVLSVLVLIITIQEADEAITASTNFSLDQTQTKNVVALQAVATQAL